MSLFAFDTETHCIQPGLLAPPIVCGSFAYPACETAPARASVESPDEVMKLLRRRLEDDFTICGANIAYDFGCVLARDFSFFPLIWRAYEEQRVFDVQIASLLHAIAEGRCTDGDLFRPDGARVMSGRYSLDECVKEWLKRDDAKANDTWRLSYALLEKVPMGEWPADALQYPKDDALNTLQVAEAQLALPALNLHNMPAQAHAAFCMHLGAMWGLRTDPESVKAFSDGILTRQSQLKERFLAEGLYRQESKKGVVTLVKDTKALKARVEEAYLGSPPTTAKGATQTDRVALEESGDELLEQFAEVSKLDKLATYLPALEEATRVPYNVQPNVLVATGRSSYQGLIQLIPRKGGVRECFTARPGKVWSSVDYSAIELSTLAQVCIWAVKYSRLGEAINAGLDPHAAFAASMVGEEYDVFQARLKAGDKEAKSKRQAAKAANFGFPGMMGAPKFVIAQRKQGGDGKVCEWTHRDGQCGTERVREWHERKLDAPLCRRCLEEADRLRAKYLQQWPEVRAYWMWIEAHVEPVYDSIKQFVSDRQRGGLHAPSAANTMFQGLAADGAKAAVVELTRRMYAEPGSALYGSRLVLFAHDETILEMDEATAHEAAHEQATVMVECMKRFVPDVAVKAEPALMRRWSKSAEAKYVDGRLVPWD